MYIFKNKFVFLDTVISNSVGDEITCDWNYLFKFEAKETDGCKYIYISDETSVENCEQSKNSEIPS